LYYLFEVSHFNDRLMSRSIDRSHDLSTEVTIYRLTSSCYWFALMLKYVFLNEKYTVD